MTRTFMEYEWCWQDIVRTILIPLEAVASFIAALFDSPTHTFSSINRLVKQLDGMIV